MKARLTIEYYAVEGAVVRMLGLVERRGFRVTRIAMAEQPCGRRSTLVLAVTAGAGERSAEILALQLGRLHGVTQVTHDSHSFRDKAA